MQNTRSTLLFVLGIPAGYLPLLAAVELGPGEVGLTLSLLTAFGCLEALRAERTSGPSRSGRIAWRVARITFMYACCVVIGFLISVWTTNAAGPGAVQRSLFGEPRGLLPQLDFFLTIFVFRLAAVWFLALVSWFAALVASASYRRAFWLSLVDSPIVVLGLWGTSGLLFHDSTTAWWGSLLPSLAVVGSALVVASRHRPSRTRPQVVDHVGAGAAPPKRPLQFSLGALLVLTAICGLWSSLVLYSSREPRGDRRIVSMVALTGTLTYKERPIADAVVTFLPDIYDHTAPDLQRPAQATTDAAGNFKAMTYIAGLSADGILPGTYMVMITPQHAGVSPGAGAPSPFNDATFLSRYADVNRSGLKVTVEPKRATEVTFDLE